MSEIEAKVRAYGQKRNTEALQKYVESVNTDELEEVVATRITHADFSTFWNYLFQAFTGTSQSSDKRYKVVQRALNELKEKDVSAKLTKLVIARLCVELPKFKTEQLLALCLLCTEYIQHGNVSEARWRELLPELLNVIIEREHVEHNDEEMTGLQYKTQFINSLCMLQWSTNMIISLAAMFIDIPLSKEEHLQVVNKLGQYMEQLTPQEIPTFVYQLLRLARHQNSRSIFLRLQNYFETRIYSRAINRNDTNSESMDVIGDSSDIDCVQAESTVLYHIYQSALLGHESVKDYINSLKNLTKSPEFVLHPFQLTVLLIISTVATHEEKVFEIVRSCISKSFHEDHKKIESYWFRDMIPSTAKVEAVLKQVMDVSISERDLVVQGLVNLGFALLGVGAALGRDTIAEKQWQLGKFVLISLVKDKRHVAYSVLQILCNRIVTGYNAAPCMDCFYRLTKRFPIIALENKRYLVELMEALLYVPEAISDQILHAIMPLTKISPTIRDHLILLLKKALNSREINSRLMAVRGFLQLLKHLKITNPAALSQLSNSSSSSSNLSVFTQISLSATGHAGASTFSNEALCLEVVGSLRRCFMQQAEVREQFYDGLYGAVCANPEIGGPVLDLMWWHFKNYYVSNKDTLPPLVFSKITSTKDLDVQLQEPLGKLIYTVGCTVTKVLEKDETNASALQFVDVLKSLSVRMANCELVHFELDDGTNLLDIVPESQQKLIILKEIMCVYEALIGYLVYSWRSSAENYAQMSSSLFQGYSRLSQFMKNLPKPKKADKKKKDADKTTQQNETSTSKESTQRAKSLRLPNTVLDLRVLEKFLRLLLGNVNWATVSQANMLKTKRDLHRHVMQSLIQLLQGLKHKKLADSRTSQTYYSMCTEIGKILNEKCIDRLEEFVDFDKDTAILAVECFHLILQFVFSHYAEDVNDFLSIIVNKDKADSLVSLLTPLVETYEKLFESEEDSSDDADVKKLLLLVANTLMLLVSKIPVDTSSALANQFLDWSKNFASTRTLSSKPVISGFVSLWLNANIKFKSGTSLFENVINDLCHPMGTISEDKDYAAQKFKLVNEASAHTLVQLLSNTIKQMLDDLDWIINRLRSEHGMITYPGQDGIERRREYLKSKERGVCCQMCLMITLSNLLTDIAVPTGAHSEAILKNLVHVYSTLNSLTKYFIMRSSKVNVAFQGARFERVVKLSGKLLSPSLNRFILYIEDSQKDETANTQATRKKTADSLKSKVLRETKLIPKVVLEMEQFGKSVIQLSNKTKVDLFKYIGPGTTRDFRIKDIKDVLEKSGDDISATLGTSNDDSSLGNEADEVIESRSDKENESDESDSPPKKKSK